MAEEFKWIDKTTKKFLVLYEKYPCLWDPNSPEYEVQEIQDKAYDSIVNEMNKTKFGKQEVKNKIKELKSTYDKEMKNKRKSEDRGQVYTPEIKWLDEAEKVFSIPGPSNEDTVSHGSSSAKKITKKKSLNETENEHDFFGRSVALQLKKLSAANALIAQRDIQKLLSELGINELK